MKFQSITLTAIIAATTLFAVQAQSNGSYAPRGSYQLCCINLSYDSKTQWLTASCFRDKRHLGKSFTTGLPISACQPGADIESIEGYLQCQAKDGTWGHDAAVPKGSYQQSCVEWMVVGNILTAQCWNYSQGKIDWEKFFNEDASEVGKYATFAQLNLSECGMLGDIENLRGQLVCTQLATGNASPDNHHSVEPGTCKEGYVWRQADPSDHVCVISQRRQDVANETATSGQFTDPNSRTKPPQCKYGYVWRQAYAGDSVCTTPQARAIALQENAAAASHTY